MGARYTIARVLLMCPVVWLYSGRAEGLAGNRGRSLSPFSLTEASSFLSRRKARMTCKQNNMAEVLAEERSACLGSQLRWPCHLLSLSLHLSHLMLGRYRWCICNP